MSALLQAEQALAEGRLVEAAKLVAEAFAAARSTAAEMDALDVDSPVVEAEARAFNVVSFINGARSIFAAIPAPTAEVVELMTMQVRASLEAVTVLAMAKMMARLTADEGLVAA